MIQPGQQCSLNLVSVPGVGRNKDLPFNYTDVKKKKQKKKPARNTERTLSVYWVMSIYFNTSVHLDLNTVRISHYSPKCTEHMESH